MAERITFVFAGNRDQYEHFIYSNHLDRRLYPRLNETNWNGVHNAEIIRIGTFFENQKLLDMLPHIENYIREGHEKAKP